MSLAKYMQLYREYGFFNGSTIRVRIPDTSFYGSDLILSKDGNVLRTRTIDDDVVDFFTDESGTLVLSADNGTSTLLGEVKISAYGTYNITLEGVSVDKSREVYAEKDVTLDDDKTTDTVAIGYTGDISKISAVSSNTSVCTVSVNGNKVTVKDAGKDFNGKATITATVEASQNYDAGEVNFYVNKLNGSLGTWADASDDVIANMVARADAGEIDLGDYWKVGETRRVHLDAVEAGTIVSNQPEQDVDLVLLHYAANSTYYDLTSPITSGRKHPMFVVGTKDCLKNTTNAEFVIASLTNGYSRETGVNLYALCNSDKGELLSWIDENIINALPSNLQPIFKAVNINFVPSETSRSSGSSYRDGTYTVLGKKSVYSTLPSTKELGITMAEPTSTSVIGCFVYTRGSSSYETPNSQAVQSVMNYGEVLNYYSNENNRIKKKGTNGNAIDYFVRNFAAGLYNANSENKQCKTGMYVDSNGSPQTLNTDSSAVRNISRGISPIMFI